MGKSGKVTVCNVLWMVVNAPVHGRGPTVTFGFPLKGEHDRARCRKFQRDQAGVTSGDIATLFAPDGDGRRHQSLLNLRTARFAPSFIKTLDHHRVRQDT